MDRREFVWLGAAAGAVGVGGLLTRASARRGPAGAFEDVGSPVGVGRLQAVRVGPDPEGRRRWVYFAFSQAKGRPPFLVVVDPATDWSRQVFPPEGVDLEGLKCLFPGRDGCMYLGSFGPARLLRFDPTLPSGTMEDLGPLPGAKTLWWIREAADRRLYMTTSLHAGLFSFDPADGRVRHVARLSRENEYATHLVVSEDGWTLYAVVAPDKRGVVAFDVRSGRVDQLLDESLRTVGFFGIYAGEEGVLKAELPDAGDVHFPPRLVDPGPPWHDLEDGSSTQQSTAENLVLSASGEPGRRLPLRYEAVAEMFTMFSGPDDRVFAFTASPLRMCVHDPGKGGLEVLGNPFAQSHGSVGAVLTVGAGLLLAAYPRSDLSIYDPSRRWEKGPTPEHNPWTWGELSQAGHTTPMDLVAGPPGQVFLGGDGGYGDPGGAVACLDLATGDLLYNLREPFRGRSVRALATNQDASVLYVGCGHPPGGSDARVVAWDTAERRVLWEVGPVSGASAISSLTWVAGKVCGTTMQGGSYERQRFFALDPGTGLVLHEMATGLSAVINGNLRLGPDGWLYGLTHVRPTLFRVDPVAYRVERIATTSRARGYGLAVTSRALYFGYEGTLRSFVFSEPLRRQAVQGMRGPSGGGSSGSGPQDGFRRLP